MKILPARLSLVSFGCSLLMMGGSLALADDAKPQADTSKKETTTTAKTDDKNAKSIADAGKKIDLSTPMSKVQIHGQLEVGYQVNLGGKGNCFNKTGPTYGLLLGTEIQVSKDVSLGIQFGASNSYYHGFGLR